MKLSLQRKNDLPLYRQIANQIREYIRTGALPVGSRLPTIRDLAHEYGLTRLTIQSAYAELQSEGWSKLVLGAARLLLIIYPFQPLFILHLFLRYPLHPG